MKRNGKRELYAGLSRLALFAVWTGLIQTVDVQPAGQAGTEIGFGALNGWFHRFTGVHMRLYALTDWLGLIPVGVCILFAGLGALQLIRRKRLGKVDFDILLLGLYYAAVIACYLFFESFPINYRPVLIEGRLEASYPSSTTLLVLSVMPTLTFQSRRRLQNPGVRKCLCIGANLFSVCMVVGRMLSGVHWITDIVGAILLSRGLFRMYRAMVWLHDKEN